MENEWGTARTLHVTWGMHNVNINKPPRCQVTASLTRMHVYLAMPEGSSSQLQWIMLPTNTYFNRTARKINIYILVAAVINPRVSIYELINKQLYLESSG